MKTANIFAKYKTLLISHKSFKLPSRNSSHNSLSSSKKLGEHIALFNFHNLINLSNMAVHFETKIFDRPYVPVPIRARFSFTSSSNIFSTTHKSNM